MAVSVVTSVRAEVIAMTTRKPKSQRDLRKETVERIVRRIQVTPDDPDIENQIAHACDLYDPGIRDDIIDALCTESYSDGLQERLNHQGRCVELSCKGKRAINVTPLSSVNRSVQCLELLEDLIGPEVARAPRMARLNRRERQVWYLWLRQYSLLRIAVEIYETSGACLSVDEVAQIRDAAQNKVMNCAALGWLTAFVEDQLRSTKRPVYWSLRQHLGRVD